MGFSPDGLMFGHTVHIPLAVLQADWKEADLPVNLTVQIICMGLGSGELVK